MIASMIETFGEAPLHGWDPQMRYLRGSQVRRLGAAVAAHDSVFPGEVVTRHATVQALLEPFRYLDPA